MVVALNSKRIVPSPPRKVAWKCPWVVGGSRVVRLKHGNPNGESPSSASAGVLGCPMSSMLIRVELDVSNSHRTHWAPRTPNSLQLPKAMPWEAIYIFFIISHI